MTIYGGNYGWWVDNAAEKEMILEDLKAGKDVTREPVYSQTANSHGENDYGNTYVEINLTAQHLFFYKNGSLVVESDFVSGNLAKNHGTPSGSFGVTYKARMRCFAAKIMSLRYLSGCLLTVVLECMMPAGEVLLVEQFIKEAVHMDVSIFHTVQQKQFMKI